jgi:GAF domain-containing protein
LIPEELITKVVNLINERFQYPTAIFMIDPTNRYAELIDAAGSASPDQKIQGYRVELGDKSCISSAILTGQARIAENSEEKAFLVDPGIIPEMQSEIAVPLIANGRIIGGMDVQSTQEAAFGKEEINILQGISNQVAIALENARLFQETQKSLDEVRAVQRTYITEAWSETTRELDGYEYVNNNERTETDGETTTVNVPLTLRDQIIGHLQLEGDQEWVQDERNLIEAVATQATLALENARLLNESQQIAIQERLVAEITSKIWTSASIDGIMQTTIKELSRAFSAAEGSISLEVRE